MHDALFASLLVATAVLMCAGAIAWGFHRERLRALDATLEAHRSPGMGEPSTVAPSDWEPNADFWRDTPIYSRLDAEALRAELDDDEAVARWVGGTGA